MPTDSNALDDKPSRRMLVAPTGVKMAWARSQEGETRHVDEVQTGKACGCVCLDCGGIVYAKNKGKRAHHFQHAADTHCSGEGVLHRVAKELVALIARTEGILLPESLGVIEREGLRGDIVLHEWRVPSQVFMAAESELESQHWRHVIPDVLLTDAAGRLLVVEVAVTHFKGESEADFYRQQKVDAVEIDLSGVSWRSTRQDLIDRLKGKVPYRWIFRGDALEVAERVGREAEKSDVLARAESVQNLPSLAPALFSHTELGELNRIVPGIDAVASRMGLNGDELHEKHIEMVRIQEVLDPWRIEDERWVNRALVGARRKEVNLYIQPAWILSKQGEQKPYLLPALVISVPESGSNVRAIPATWHGIKSWREKARAIALKRLDARILKDQQKQNRLDSFKRKFAAASVTERVKLIERKWGRPFPYDPGSFDKHWQAHDAIWKALLWIYCIQPSLNKMEPVHVERLARHEWVCGLLGLEPDDAAMLARKKQIDDWLRPLAEQGLAVRGLAGWYEFSCSLGDGVFGLREKDFHERPGKRHS